MNSVILNGKHTYFGQIEKAIQACEIEGVEAWLIADFFQTQVSRTSFDDFYGRPVLVFRSAPEASWQGVAKQLLDFFGAFFLLILVSPVLLLVALIIKLTSPGPILFQAEALWRKWAALHHAQVSLHDFQRRAEEGGTPCAQRNGGTRVQADE